MISLHNDGELLVYTSFADEILGQELSSKTELRLILITDQQPAPDDPTVFIAAVACPCLNC